MMSGQWTVAWRSIIRVWFPISAALVAGFLVGSASHEPGIVQAEIRRSPPRAAFQTGAERSETTLREISATLKRIDARLARFERTVGRSQQKKVPSR